MDVELLSIRNVVSVLVQRSWDPDGAGRCDLQQMDVQRDVFELQCC